MHIIQIRNRIFFENMNSRSSTNWSKSTPLNKLKKNQSQQLLSVVITSYNYRLYINETFNSLINQSEKNFEIIVVDDGSTDGSVNLIIEWMSKYKNIKFYQHRKGINKGLPASVRLGIQKATGKYIAFCESDDYWDERHVENLLKYIKVNPNAALLFNRIKIINNSSRKGDYEDYVAKSNDFLMKNNINNIFLSLSNNYMPTFSAACIRRDLLLKCDFNSYYPQYVDFWLWRQLCLIYPIHFVSDAITYWRKHDESYDVKQNISDITDFLMANNQLLMQKVSMPWFKRFEIIRLYRLNKKNTEIIEKEMEFIYRESNLKRKNAMKS